MTDWRDSEKAKRLKAKYFADAVDSCGQAVARQRNLTPEERVDLTLRCTVEALDTLESKSKSREVEASEKWFLKGRAHDHCLVNKVASHPFDADRFVQQQADEMHAKPPGMSKSAAWLKLMPEEFQAYKAREAEETAAALGEAGRVLRDLTASGTSPPACNATADPDVSPEDVRQALHCLEEAQKALSAASYRKFLEVCTSDLPPTALTALGFTTTSVAALPTARAALKKAQRALVAASRQQFRDFCSALLPPAVQDALGFTPAAATPARPPPPRSRLAGGDNPPPSGEAPPRAVSAKARALVIPESTSSPDAVLLNQAEGTIEDEVRFNPFYEPLDEEMLRFEAAHPISPTDAVITRKFSLLPSMELPEEVRIHLNQVVTAFYNGGDPATRHLLNAYFDVCFAHFQHLVNAMIREGLRLPPVVRINVERKDEKGKVLKDAAGKTLKEEVDYEVFAKDTQYAEKRFGNLVIEQAKQALGKSPWLARLKKLDKAATFQFHNRVGRCAGAVAYHIVRNYRIQWRVTSKLVETLLHPLKVPLKGTKAGKAPSLGRLVRALFEEEVQEEEETKTKASVTIDPLATLFDRQFPLSALVTAGQKALEGQDLPKGYFNFTFLCNSFRYLRNLLRVACQTGPVKRKPEALKEFRQTLERGLAAAKAGVELDGALMTWLSQPHVADTVKAAKTKTPPTQTELEFQLEAFLRRLSARLTKRVRFLLRMRRAVAKKGKPSKRGQKRIFGEGVLDPLIQEILDQDHRRWAEITSAKAWQKSRQKWRDQLYQSLDGQLSSADVGALVREAVQQVNATPEGDFLLRMFDLRPARTAFASGDFAEFLTFLRAQIRAEAESVLVQEFYRTLRPKLIEFLQLLQDSGPAQFSQLRKLPFFKRPCYAGRSIPTAHAQDQKVCDITQTGSTVRVALKLEAGFPLQFTLATKRRRKNPAQGDRYQPFIDAKWDRRPGTLLKASGGGLLLALPFSKSVKSQAPVTKQAQMPARVAGLDLGLKDFGAISVFEGDREVARQFLDQWQLQGQRAAWFLPPDPATADANRQRFFNWKNRLRFLREEAASYQARLADYKNQETEKGLSSKRLHHRRKFQELRRAWKRCWRKVTCLHEELARQIATRVVVFCEYYQVAVLRVEDLRWARHKPKAQAGYFLTANQVHWFHGQIQERIKDLARRVGLQVELVKARDTSKACSRCADGTLGTWDGKRFVHQHCPRNGGKPFQLDADLGAARNIARALPHGLASD